MVDIAPFKGIRYNHKKVGDLSRVLTPPYDVISPHDQRRYYTLSPFNFIRIILGEEFPGDNDRYNRYTRAETFLKDWLKKNILIRDKTNSIYIYKQTYEHDGKKRARLGFIALMKLDDTENGNVFPHEHTFTAAKQDRSKLMEATNSNLSPIFGLFSDTDAVLYRLLSQKTKLRPTIDTHFENVRHQFWRVADRHFIDKIKDIMKKKEVFIADGHHRYEVALAYRQMMRKKYHASNLSRPFDYCLMYFSGITKGGPTILPTHRLIKTINGLDAGVINKRLSKFFYIDKLKNPEELLSVLKKSSKEHLFGIYCNDSSCYLLGLKDRYKKGRFLEDMIGRHWKRLDVAILHKLILEKLARPKDKKKFEEQDILYTRDEKLAVGLVRKGDFKAAFFLNPPKVSQVKSVAKARQRMPHKSTYFYPKVLAGLVINRFGN